MAILIDGYNLLHASGVFGSHGRLEESRAALLDVLVASIEPKYLARPGSGWETLMHFGNTVLQDQVLFASTWLFMGKSIRRLADEVMKLPLRDAVKRKWLYHNAARLFGLE